MNRKLKNILKVSIILFILLLVNFSKVYALDEQMIEKYYEKIETEDGIFYKRKDLKEVNGLHISVSSSGISSNIYDDYLKLSGIIKEKVDTLIKEFISKLYDLSYIYGYNLFCNILKMHLLYVLYDF